MRTEIEKLIASDTEPVYALSGYLQQLAVERKGEFWDCIKELILQGNENQQFVGLSFLSFEEHEFQTELIDIFTSKINPQSVSNLLTPILRMIKNLQRIDLVPYCQNVLASALERKDSRTIEMAFRTILSLEWKSALNQILDRVENGSTSQVIDTMAFFKSTHSSSDWNDLLKTLNDPHRKKIEKLEKEILLRSQNHYERLFDK